MDEAVTVGLLHLDFGEMLRTIPASESTPPLYYVLAWIWTRPFGTGEFALRSLSALAGIATIPVCITAARQFVSDRASMVTGLLASVSPILVWYSQEARAYSSLVLFCALTLLAFGRALQAPTRSTLGLWSFACVLAVATHYFAGFLVLAEALWLLGRGATRTRTLIALVPVALAVGALAPLALHQRQQGHLAFLGSTSLGSRLADTAKSFVSGQTGPLVAHWPVVGIILAGTGLVLLTRMPAQRRRRLAPLAAVALAALILPIALAVIGEDYVLARNLLPVWPAGAVLVAAGLAAGRPVWLSTLAAGALVALSVAFCVAVPLTPKLRREAINARLSSVRGQSAVVDITYALIAPGRTGSSTANCPAGFRTQRGGLQPVGRTAPASPGEARSHRLYARWTATISNLSRHAVTYELTAVCVPAPGSHRAATASRAAGA